jgi:hypothetical protein
MAKRGRRQRGWRRLDGQRWKDGAGSGESREEIGRARRCCRKRRPGGFGGKDGRSEGLMDLAARIDGDRSEIVEMRGG